MSNIRACACENFNLSIIQVNAMSKSNVSSSDSDRVQIGDVALTCLALDHLYLRAILRSVRVNHHASLARKLRNLHQHLARATDSKARRKAVAYAPIGSTMPLFKQR